MPHLEDCRCILRRLIAKGDAKNPPWNSLDVVPERDFTSPAHESRWLHFQPRREPVAFREPHFDTYSIPARICFAVAMSGGALLLAVAIASTYFMQ